MNEPAIPKPHDSRNTKVSSREAALQMIYALELGGQDREQVVRWYQTAHPMSPDSWARACNILEVVSGNQGRIEGLIQQRSPNRKLERISVIDRSLLKVAIAEMLSPNPAASIVIINAALRLARKYSQPNGAGFLHAALDSISRELKA